MASLIPLVAIINIWQARYFTVALRDAAAGINLSSHQKHPDNATSSESDSPWVKGLLIGFTLFLP